MINSFSEIVSWNRTRCPNASMAQKASYSTSSRNYCAPERVAHFTYTSHSPALSHIPGELDVNAQMQQKSTRVFVDEKISRFIPSPNFSSKVSLPSLDFFAAFELAKHSPTDSPDYLFQSF
ncbi:hypothetical protein TNCV_1147481 [Trichonephila clavipes]|nr:hypothetical protein TNCV_1147481 [Trichonephila clavipes]